MIELMGMTVGFVIALILGYVVSWLVHVSTGNIELPPPAGINKEEWLAAIRMPSEVPGRWLGALERILSFVAFATNGLEIIAGLARVESRVQMGDLAQYSTCSRILGGCSSTQLSVCASGVGNPNDDAFPNRYDWKYISWVCRFCCR